MYYRKLFVFLFVVQSVAVHATSKQQSENLCAPKAPEELLFCALKHNPDLQIQELVTLQQKSEETIARQIPNLELDSRLLYGTSDSSLSSEVSLVHIFELGGKRGARIGKAQKKQMFFNGKLFIKQQEVLADTWIKLNRLRQLNHEIELLQEAAVTYRQIRRRFSKFPRLSPEQELSSNVFLFAANENEEHIKNLKNARLILLQEIKIALGVSEQDVLKYLPKTTKSWPEIKEEAIEKSPYVFVEQARLSISKAELEFQRAQAWPNLAIGPSADFLSGRSVFQADIGVSFAFTIPLYHQNQGEKEHARRGIKVSKRRLQLLKDSLLKKRNTLMRIYMSSTKNLRILSRLAVIKRKHARLHSLLNRGVIHTSMVIEQHRQEFDLITRAHENELKAIEALWAIYAIDGRILSRKSNEKTK